MRITGRLLSLGLTTVVTASLVALPATGGHAAAPHRAAGPWHLIDGSAHVITGTPVVWEDAHHVATVLWSREPSTSQFTYETTHIAAKGTVSTTLTDVFAGGHFESLSTEPALLSDAGAPLVVFNGARASGKYKQSCIYGAKGGSGAWTLQSWSLSNDCFNSKGSAGEGKNGVIAAAWGLAGWVGGHGVEYRVGTSATIPASGADSRIPVDTHGADAAATGVAADTAGTGHFYVAWTRVFTNNNSDGYYVEDVTAHSAAMKAPGTGTNSTNRLSGFANLAIANRNTHPGVYLAYCSNAATCHVQLWRVGAAKAMTVPGSADAYSESISAAPSARLWIAWFNGSTNKVSVVRTNKAVTRFGPVQTFATPCAEHGLLGLSSGSSGRLDIALQCVANSNLRAQEYAEQVLVPLSVSVSPKTVSNTAAHSITVTVRDAGDPVAHATVRYAGQKVSTNASGQATIHVAKGTATGSKHVSVSATDYRSGGANFQVTH